MPSKLGLSRLDEKVNSYSFNTNLFIECSSFAAIRNDAYYKPLKVKEKLEEERRMEETL